MKISKSGVSFAVDASLVGSLSPMAEGDGFDAALGLPDGTALLGQDASGYQVAVELGASQVDVGGPSPKVAGGACEVTLPRERPCVPFRVVDGVREHMVAAEGSGVDPRALASALELRPRVVRVEPERVDERHMGGDPTRPGALRADVELDGLRAGERDLDGMRLTVELTMRQAVELRSGHAVGVKLDPIARREVWAKADGGRPRMVEPPLTIDELAAALGEGPKPEAMPVRRPRSFPAGDPVAFAFDPVRGPGPLDGKPDDDSGEDESMSLDDMIDEVL